MQLPMSFAEIVDEIVRYTSFSREEVEYRVWMEAIDSGWNVLQDVARFGVTPFIDTPKMSQLYQQGDGFIFETMVFWAKPGRNRWTKEALERVRSLAARQGRPHSDIRILMFGDGTGSDSIFFACHDFQVDYFDFPDSATSRFAIRRFDGRGLLDSSIHPIADYKSFLKQEYDVVLSFEVLEHLPDPIGTIHDISLMLKDGGIAIVTDDFGDITPQLPTHLKSNSKYLGRTPFLFLDQGLHLSWYNKEIMFKPMEYVKRGRPSTTDRVSLLQDYNVRSLYLWRYTGRIARFIEKLAYFRVKRTHG